jgi:hypothetical protein
MLFRISGLRNLSEQLNDVFAAGGQFFRSFESDLGVTNDLPPVDANGQNCLQLFRFLLNHGNVAFEKLCSRVDQNRNLRLWRQISVNTMHLRLGQTGQIENRFGQKLEAPWQAVGEWLGSEEARPLYLSALSLEPQSGKLQYYSD